MANFPTYSWLLSNSMWFPGFHTKVSHNNTIKRADFQALIKRVNASHTRYRASGLDLILVKQAVSPQVTQVIHRRQAAITFRQACGYLPSRTASLPIGRYSFYRTMECRRLSQPGRLVTYRNKVPPPGVEPEHGHPSQC